MSKSCKCNLSRYIVPVDPENQNIFVSYNNEDSIN